MKNRINIASRLACSSLLQPVTAITAVIGFVTAIGACAKVQQTDSASGTGNTTGSATGTGGSRGGDFTSTIGQCSQCTDFPSTPYLDTGSPANAATMFSGKPPTGGAGPCIVEPQDDTLFPNDWLRPRIRFLDTAGKLVKITLEAPNQVNVLTAYTTSDHWIVPKDVWANLRFHQINDYVTVTVWAQGGGASKVTFRTASVGAGGNLIFWAAKPTEVDKNLDTDCPKDSTGQPMATCYQGDSELRGFTVGDETTIPVLKIGQIKQQSKDNNNKTSQVRCIGCHAGVPGGDFVAFNDGWPWRGVMAGVTATNVGTSPTYLSQGGLEDLWQPALGVMTFSPMHWSETDRKVITSYSLTSIKQNDWYNANRNPRPSLVWFDLLSPPVPLMNGNGNYSGDIANPQQIYPIEGVNMGTIARTGDPRGGTTPNWSHDGQTIAYTSTDAALDGRLDNQPPPNPNPNNEVHNKGHADIWTVPYGERAGGTATPVKGADTAAFEEYFPSFSPDDSLIAFNRVPASEAMYSNPNSEIAVISATGGTVTPLEANKPAACTKKTSPGVNNHWARWSPNVGAGKEGRYYWIVFSSNRTDIPAVTSKYGPKRSIPISQLYIAPVIMDETQIPKSYPAIYLWNQPTDTVNTTPAWEVFQIPGIE